MATSVSAAVLTPLEWEQLGQWAEVPVHGAGPLAVVPTTSESAGSWSCGPQRMLLWCAFFRLVCVVVVSPGVRRAVGNALFLLETSLHMGLSRNALKLLFAANIVPSVTFADCTLFPAASAAHSSLLAAPAALLMLVLTADNAVHRFHLPRATAGPESLLAPLHQSQLGVPRAMLETLPVFASDLSFARCAPGHAGHSLVLVGAQAQHPVYVVSLHPNTTPHVEMLDALVACECEAVASFFFPSPSPCFQRPKRRARCST